MLQLSLYILGQNAIEYARKKVMNMNNNLSKYILEAIDLKNGRIYTYLPIEVDKKEIYNFNAGGKIPVPDERIVYRPGCKLVPILNTIEHLIKMIQDYLAADVHNICVINEAILYLSEIQDAKWISPDDERIFVSANDIYYILRHHHSTDIEKIKETILYSPFWMFTCVMTSISIKEFGKSSLATKIKLLTINQLKVLARNTNKIVVEAYDGEGYIIWEKQGGVEGTGLVKQ